MFWHVKSSISFSQTEFRLSRIPLLVHKYQQFYQDFPYFCHVLLTWMCNGHVPATGTMHKGGHGNCTNVDIPMVFITHHYVHEETIGRTGTIRKEWVVIIIKEGHIFLSTQLPSCSTIQMGKDIHSVNLVCTYDECEIIINSPKFQGISFLVTVQELHFTFDIYWIQFNWSPKMITAQSWPNSEEQGWPLDTRTKCRIMLCLLFVKILIS